MSYRCLALLFGIAAATAAPVAAEPSASQTARDRNGQRQRFVVTGGTATFRFSRIHSETLGFDFIAQGKLNTADNAAEFAFSIEPSSTFEVKAEKGVFGGIVGGALRTRGALLLDKPGRRVVIGNLAIEADSNGVMVVRSFLNEKVATGETAFELESVMLDIHTGTGEFRLIGELSIARSWANTLGFPAAAGTVIGTVVVEAELESADDGEAAEPAWATDGASKATGRSLAVDGSDVIVAILQTVRSYEPVEGIPITAFAVGTTACNVGNRRANWIASTSNHPVIIQNAYRLKDDRFEQIGLSWLKHGFYAVSQDVCGKCEDETNGSQLGVGCSDPYSATLNGIQTNMSPRSTINPLTGVFPYPWPGWEDGPPAELPIERRLQIHDVDLDPRFNVGARYFVQGHYILQDDATAGTSHNNASYREVLAENPSPGVYQLNINPDWSTQRGQPAVRAWQNVDDSVEEIDIQIPGEGLFILAAKASETPTGTWRYSYALQNLNSDQAADSFSVPLPPGALMANIGFHDVDYHSGDPYDPTDWAAVVTDEAITWSVAACEPNENANALRFGTVYSFYFECNIQPEPTLITIGLFKPGTYSEITGIITGPKLLLVDCNDNNVSDACDIDCGAGVCEGPCGDSADCNVNGIPDECEPGCNNNNVPDDCDVDVTDPDGNGEVSADCQPNGIPDECEFDCDGNDIPDDCEVIPDNDGDGVINCYDSCPDVPVGVKCDCPARGDCCLPSGDCYSDMGLPLVTPEQCEAAGGTPACITVPCRDGCRIGDFDLNGTLDLFDIAALQRCMGADASNLKCVTVFDGQGDDDVDLLDYVTTIHEHLTGP